MREYEYEEILTGKDIVTEKIKESDIIGKKGWFSDNLQAVVDSIDHNTMPDFLLAGTLESTTYAGRFRRKEDREYYNFFTQHKWGDASNYHLCVDAGKFTLDGAAAILAAAVRQLEGG